MILSPYIRCLLLIPVVVILILNVRVSVIMKHQVHDHEAEAFMHMPPKSIALASKPATGKIKDVSAVRREEAQGEESGDDDQDNQSEDASKQDSDQDGEDDDKIDETKQDEEPSKDQSIEAPQAKQADKNMDGEPSEDEDTSKEAPLNSVPLKQLDANPNQNNHLAQVEDPDTFAACLQIMDDNHFLIEWLAYHYHVMPLRRLIVLVDPNSNTSPEPILNRWKDRINITLWHQIDIYPNGIPPPPDKKKNTTKLGEHRARQRRFIRNCLQTFHNEGRQWVVLTDTDEYTLINERIRDPTDELSPLNYTGKQLPIPTQSEPGSVMKALQMKDLKILHTDQFVYNNPCITMARKTFGTKETDPDQKTIVGYNSHDFQTLHWRYYDKTFKPGKALLNLQEIRYKDISSNPSVHRPITGDKVCKGKLAVYETKSVFVTHHYPGNLQQMLFRVGDARGDASNATAYRIERFEKYKKFADKVESKNIQDWLQGFVDSVGLDQATKLLEFVGLPDKASYSDQAAQRDLSDEKEAGDVGEDSDGEEASDAADVADKGLPTTKQAANIAEAEQASESGSEDGDGSDTAETSTVVDTSNAQKATDRSKSADHALQQPLQPIASIDDPDTFAGCLQIMDDNHFLIEWLAYHYHVMPLRRLIVLVDPHSRTTPQPILDRWKDKIKISFWHEKDIFPRGIPPPPNKKKNATKLGRHRVRQKQFILTCLKNLKKEGREWVVLTDTDEYTMLNDRLRGNMMTDLRVQNATLPSQEEPGSIMKVLKQNLAKDPVSQTPIGNFSCITMARRTFSTRQDKNAQAISYGYETANFQTLHWRYYSTLFKPGKALLNLKRVQYSDLPARPSVHRPIHDRSICVGKVSLNEQQSVFAVNHYPGTLEQMLFRDMDARGDAANATAYRIERFKNYTKIGKIWDPHGIQDWLPGFISTVGEKEAKSLLEHVGIPNEAATFLAPSDVEMQ